MSVALGILALSQGIILNFLQRSKSEWDDKNSKMMMIGEHLQDDQLSEHC